MDILERLITTERHLNIHTKEKREGKREEKEAGPTPLSIRNPGTTTGDSRRRALTLCRKATGPAKKLASMRFGTS